MEEKESLGSEHGAAQYWRFGVHARVPIVVSWYFHPLLFFTIIASDMRVPFVTGKRDSLYARARSDVLVFPLVSLFRDVRSSAYVQAALIKNERHFFSYYVNGINVIVSFLIVTSPTAFIRIVFARNRISIRMNETIGKI